MSGNLGKKALLDLTVPLARDALPKLATKTTLSVLDKFKRKICGKGVVRAGKGFTLFISNEDKDDIIKTIESLEKSGLLTDVATKKVKHEKQEGGFLGGTMAPMASSLIVPLINAITGKGVMTAGKGQEGRFIPLLALRIMMKVWKKESVERGEGIIRWIIWIKVFSSVPSFK